MYNQGPKETLAALLAGRRFPHALLIEGPEGSGKRTLAMEAAASLLCRAPAGERPCGSCPACKKLRSGSHPDFMTVDGAAQRSVSVDAVRGVRQEAYIAPHESERRIFFFPSANALTVQAQNALLKLIEEPPRNVFFILTAPGRSLLLPTVVSRAIVITMEETTKEQRFEALQKLRPDAGEEAMRRAARLAPTIGQALAALADETYQRLSADAFSLLDLAEAKSRYGILRLLASYEKDRERFLRLIAAAKAAALARAADLAREGSISLALQCGIIVDIMDWAAAAARQNVGLGLLSALLADRLVRMSAVGQAL